jgi:molybdate transport system permease protein
LSGAILAYARALGEFGATIMFAGNLPGVTQTMPLAIYTAMQSDFNTAVTISILLVMISLVIMFIVRWISGDEKNA